MARVSLPPGYALLPGPPSVADYLDLRVRAGLSLKTEAQPRAALAGGWAACRVEAGGGSVAMGRVIGDGGWYFHVLDMAVVQRISAAGWARPCSSSCSTRSATVPRQSPG